MGQPICVSYNSKYMSRQFDIYIADYDVWKVVDNIDLEAIKDFIYHNFD